MENYGLVNKSCANCGEVKALNEFGKNKAKIDGLHIYCRACVSVKNKARRDYNKEYRLKNLHALRDYDRRYADNNKEKRKSQNKNWQKKNPGYHKGRKDPDYSFEYRLKNRYGLTREAYNKMLEEQDFGCAICGGVNASGNALSVDHDHKCCPGPKTCGHCVRQLLCHKCNLGIGLFSDNTETFKKVIEYVEKHRKSML